MPPFAVIVAAAAWLCLLPTVVTAIASAGFLGNAIA
jgi:hypothetical protein